MSEVASMESKSLSNAKLAVCRYQLGTALSLFIKDRDPVSVHTLACAACEMLESMAVINKIETFSTTILKNYSQRDIREARHVYYNAFKHFDKRGKERDDDELILSFSDEVNEYLLWQGWEDLLNIGAPLPVEAQLYQYWHLSNNIDVISHEWFKASIRNVFDFNPTMDRAERKRMLRRQIEKHKRNKTLVNDPRTCQQPLSVRNWTKPLPPLDEL